VIPRDSPRLSACAAAADSLPRSTVSHLAYDAALDRLYFVADTTRIFAADGVAAAAMPGGPPARVFAVGYSSLRKAPAKVPVSALPLPLGRNSVGWLAVYSLTGALFMSDSVTNSVSCMEVA
jgi:hypothetical protein